MNIEDGKCKKLLGVFYREKTIMHYLIPDFDGEVKARVGVMAWWVRHSLPKPEDGSSIPSIYAKVEGEKGFCRVVLWPPSARATCACLARMVTTSGKRSRNLLHTWAQLEETGNRIYSFQSQGVKKKEKWNLVKLSKNRENYI